MGKFISGGLLLTGAAAPLAKSMVEAYANTPHAVAHTFEVVTESSTANSLAGYGDRQHETDDVMTLILDASTLAAAGLVSVTLIERHKRLNPVQEADTSFTEQ